MAQTPFLGTTAAGLYEYGTRCNAPWRVDSKLASGVMLADRYRVDEALPLADGSTTFLATDTTTNEKVIAFEVDPETATVLRKAVGVAHSHLATVREVLIADFGHVMIVEHVEGSTADVFADGAPRLTRVDAVRFTLRLLDALGTLHQSGVPHGSVRPVSVVIEPVGERPSPVLSHAPRTAGPYRRPEHAAGGPPVFEDDVWAIAALLYRLVTGNDPPAQGVAHEEQLKALGIDDSILPGAIAHSLAVDASARNTDLRGLRRELARWLAEHAGEDVAHASTGQGKPPPLPPGQSPPVSVATPSAAPAGISRSVPAKPAARRGRVVALAVGGVVLGVGAAYLAFALRPAPKPPAPSVATNAASAAPVPPPSAVSLGDIAVTGEETDAAIADPLASCVTAHMPKGTFKRPLGDPAWLCTEKDPRAGADRLRVELVKGAAGGAPTEAMRTMSQMGWYDMPAFVVIRTGCCNDAPALELPEPAKGCDAMAPALTELGRAVTSGQNFDDTLKHFGDIARCETTARRTALFRKQAGPVPAEETAFRELVKHVRER